MARSRRARPERSRRNPGDACGQMLLGVSRQLQRQKKVTSSERSGGTCGSADHNRKRHSIELTSFSSTRLRVKAINNLHHQENIYSANLDRSEVQPSLRDSAVLMYSPKSKGTGWDQERGRPTLAGLSSYLRYFSLDPLATCRLLVTLKIPGTLLARIPATFLSAWLFTTPFKVTLPFTTVMRMGCAGSRAYLFKLG
jgi:hypothetical protein